MPGRVEAKKCPQCGFENISDFQYCPNCGRSMEKLEEFTNNCIYCGAKNYSDAKECYVCRGKAFLCGTFQTYRTGVCLRCKISFHPHDIRCPKCGSELRNCSVPRCVYCGSRVSEFCAGCGLPCKEALKPLDMVKELIGAVVKSIEQEQKKCPKCGADMIRPEGWSKGACPKCDSDLGGGGA